MACLLERREQSMASVRQMGKEDILFVAGETAEVYHHTAGLVILDTKDCPDFSFEYLRDKVIERIRDVPHFRWRLHEVPLGLDMPYWVEAEGFRYENHFKRIAVPSPQTSIVPPSSASATLRHNAAGAFSRPPLQVPSGP